MAKKRKSKKQTRNMFLILLGLTIADFLIPDPLPVLDEVILVGWTTILGLELIK